MTQGLLIRRSRVRVPAGPQETAENSGSASSGQSAVSAGAPYNGDTGRRHVYEHLGVTAGGNSNGTPEYRAWLMMRQRCFNPTAKKYADYGARGITVCERWVGSFAAFLGDMGTKPSPAHSLDRRDNNGNYEPGNCRWATAKEQANNRRPRRRAS